MELKISPKNWEVAENGFWKNSPYIVLSNSFLYEGEKVILYQHAVLNDEGNADTYRFWTHFFSHEDLENILSKYPFQNISFHENVLPKGDLWNGDNVTFCKVITQK